MLTSCERVVVEVGFGRTQHAKRLAAQVLGALGRNHHGAIGHQAAIASHAIARLSTGMHLYELAPAIIRASVAR